jgi:hypothetical protein
MLDIQKEKDGLFTIKIAGEITPAEMDREIEKLIDITKDVKSGKLLYDIRNFEMPGVGAMMVEFRKMPELFGLIKRFDKAAVLAEAPWLRVMAEWEGMLIPGLEIKSFGHKDENRAREWLAA